MKLPTTLHCSAQRTLAANCLLSFMKSFLEEIGQPQRKLLQILIFRISPCGKATLPHPVVRAVNCQIGEGGSHHSTFKLSLPQLELEMALLSQQQHQSWENSWAMPSEFWGKMTSSLEPTTCSVKYKSRIKGSWGIPDLKNYFYLFLLRKLLRVAHQNEGAYYEKRSIQVIVSLYSKGKTEGGKEKSCNSKPNV